MRIAIVSLAVVLLLLVPTATARPTTGWTLVTSGQVPAREMPMVAYDPISKETVLFGGYNTTVASLVNDTWAYTNNTWHNLHLTHSPSERRGAAIAWDPSTNSIILFGGETRNHRTGNWFSLQDTWSFSNNTWTQLNTTTIPSVAFGTVAYYNKQLILFGGEYESGGFTEHIKLYSMTWGFTGNWHNLNVTGPTPRFASQMGYDQVNNELVLFGGTNGPRNLADTWTFNGTWHHVLTPTSPLATDFGAIQYDPTTNTSIMFSENFGAHGANETWSFVNNNWTNLREYGPTGQWDDMVYNGTNLNLVVDPTVMQVWGL